MDVGLWAKQKFTPGTTIGCLQSGAVAYFADDLHVVNLDGVVNRACYDAMVERRHLDYIRASGVSYVLDWPSNVALIPKHSADYRAGDLTSLGEISGLRSWNNPWLLVRVEATRPEGP
jgi:hypothetical protein